MVKSDGQTSAGESCEQTGLLGLHFDPSCTRSQALVERRGVGRDELASYRAGVAQIDCDGRKHDAVEATIFHSYIYIYNAYIYMYIQYLFYHDAKEAGGWLVVWVQTRCFKRYPMCLDTFVI